jgi:hypothetical protein
MCDLGRIFPDQLSVLVEGQLKTYHVPARQAEEVRRRVDLHRRFQKAAAEDRVCVGKRGRVPAVRYRSTAPARP